MKKIIFLLAISICSFTSNAQISGVVNYDSWNWLNYYEDGNMVAFDFYRCQDFLIIDIEFEQEDNYSVTQGDLTQQWSSTIYSLKLDFWELDDTIKVYGENQGLMIQFVGYLRTKELESIHVSTWNKIEGDTISICSDYGTDFINYDLDAYSYGYGYGWHHYDSTSIQVGYFDGADFYGFEFHVNDTVFPLYNHLFNDFNLKTGDVIKLQAGNEYDSYGWFYDDYGCEWSYDGIISSPELIVKIVENEKLDLIDTVSEFGNICPGESVMLTKENDDFEWYNKNNSSYSYKSREDSFLVKTPGEYLLIEDLPWNSDKQCAAMSEIVKVESKSDCKGYVSGYVKQNTNPWNPLPGIMVSDDKGQTTVSDENGVYEFYFDLDDAPTYAVISQDGYYEDKEYFYFSSSDFKFSENENLYTYKLEENDLAIHLNSGRNRPGFTIVQFVTIENRGKNELTTDVQVNLDAALTYTTYEGENQPNSVMGNELKWNNITVASGETKRLKFWAVLDRLTPLETVLSNTGVLLQAVPDDVTSNDTTVYEPLVTGSYDPNDKLVSYQGAYTEGYVYDTTSFEYTIRFQNTGTDTAFNILVTDPISSHLDLSTLKMLDASHNYQMTIVGDTIKWFFPNIMLADSFVNEPLSHGFIRFTIDQKENNEQGSLIENTAYIYFDFNDPIITNTTSAIVNNGMITQVKEVKSTNLLHKLTTYPVPTESEVFFEGVEGGYIEVYDLQGKLLRAENFNNSINVSELNSGVYHFKMITGDKSYGGNIVRK